MYIPELEYKKILELLPIICVDLIITYDSKCLLLLRDNEPAKGQWWFPGGRIHKMETIKNAAIRKAKEETNLDCDFQEIVSVEETIFEKNENMTTDIHTVNFCCHLTATNIDNLNIDNLHSDYIWTNEQSNLYHKSVNYPISLIKWK